MDDTYICGPSDIWFCNNDYPGITSSSPVDLCSFLIQKINMVKYENILIFVTLLFLAEAHFGATWPFFLSKSNTNEINALL